MLNGVLSFYVSHSNIICIASLQLGLYCLYDLDTFSPLFLSATLGRYWLFVQI